MTCYPLDIKAVLFKDATATPVTSPLGPSATTTLKVHGSARWCMLSNTGTGPLTLETRYNGVSVSGGTYALAPGRELLLPFFGLGGTMEQLPNEIVVVTAGLAACSFGFYCATLDGRG